MTRTRAAAASSPHPALRGHLPPRGEGFGAATSAPDQTKFLQSSSSCTRRGAAWQAKPPVRLCIWLPTAPRRPHRRGQSSPLPRRVGVVGGSAAVIHAEPSVLQIALHPAVDLVVGYRVFLRHSAVIFPVFQTVQHHDHPLHRRHGAGAALGAACALAAVAGVVQGRARTVLPPPNAPAPCNRRYILTQLRHNRSRRPGIPARSFPGPRRWCTRRPCGGTRRGSRAARRPPAPFPRAFAGFAGCGCRTFCRRQTARPRPRGTPPRRPAFPRR